jgi:ABC-2 type transport system ATP-binding protein
MSEMENTADHLLVIGRGRMIADCTVQEFIDQNSEQAIRVRTPEVDRLAGLLAATGATTVPDGAAALLVTGVGADRIGDVAFDNRIRLHELAPVQASLEQAFMELTRDSVEFHAAVPGSRTDVAQEAAR